MIQQKQLFKDLDDFCLRYFPNRQLKRMLRIELPKKKKTRVISVSADENGDICATACTLHPDGKISVEAVAHGFGAQRVSRDFLIIDDPQPIVDTPPQNAAH